MKKMISLVFLFILILLVQAVFGEELYDANFFVYPLDMTQSYRFTQDFNQPSQLGWCSGCDSCTTKSDCDFHKLVWYWGHTGLDIGNRSLGGTVRAVSWGQVVHIGESLTVGFGYMVRIKHWSKVGNLTFFTQYGHMEPGSIKVKVNQFVRPGQEIGRVGSTGFSSGPH